MSEVTDVWLLAVALDGEDTFWLCEPANLKPLAEDWRTTKCRWLYPVVENVSRFADLDGFASTDAVYEVEWSGMSKVLRAATLAWNVKCKRQKVDRITYVFVPAEEMKLLDEAYSKFTKLEATKPPLPRSAPATSSSHGEARETAPAFSVGPAEVKAPSKEVSEEQATENPVADTGGDVPLVDATVARAASATPIKVEAEEEEDKSSGATALEQPDAGEENGDVASSSVGRQNRTGAFLHRSSSSYNAVPSHKRQKPHQGTTVYQAPNHSKPMGDHRSGEAFDWPEMFLVHRGSVDFLCPHATNNSYGFRLDRVMHDGFPVFLLFPSSKNNSEAVDSSARGVPVFEKAKLSGEGGEGGIRNCVLVLTRLSSKKHQPYYRRNTRRRVRGGRSLSDEDSITEEEEEEEEEEVEDDDDTDDDDDSDEDEDELEDIHDDGKPTLPTQERRTSAKAKSSPPPLKTSKTEPSLATEEASAPRRKHRRRGAEPKEESPLQAVSVNFWTDPQGVVPAVGQLAKDFPFHAEGANTPQTVVFSDGVCVTYTAATAGKHAPPEKRRKAAKPGHTAASTEDADLSMLNEHILNAFAQVRKESA
ncbi:hypothetical protein ABB37_01095 [Leptomonas pyrrhocoris]|uniref:Uncharacterized protein n=1 Tax=Leptomonas pyrrhocoris TaxID=157538 RepID=A0A0M9G7Y0_LEPPY|nr:hypothetical protein ABB37_01095 [Leptomonas pyrrhocoris]KPA84560.1 hypothetical protein ABB37_01095 [Leptomonas pyrrhocoris]|eukprot:XP_015662999.1 hypothetical protein ABB37_01095 [Leptomonas pyrrhocoris]